MGNFDGSSGLSFSAITISPLYYYHRLTPPYRFHLVLNLTPLSHPLIFLGVSSIEQLYLWNFGPISCCCSHIWIRWKIKIHDYDYEKKNIYATSKRELFQQTELIFDWPNFVGLRKNLWLWLLDVICHRYWIIDKRKNFTNLP